jgi:hypothetical protein
LATDQTVIRGRAAPEPEEHARYELCHTVLRAQTHTETHTKTHNERETHTDTERETHRHARARTHTCTYSTI